MAEEGVRGVAAEKAAWRERFRRVRLGLSPAHRAAASEAIVRRVLALPEVQAAQTVHVFWPIVERGEVDTRPLVHTLHQRGVRVALPVVVRGPTPKLAHRLYEGGARLVEAPWGLREPDPAAPAVDPAEVDVIVVPGLAMDATGGRLGYGGGYYDSFLEQTDALRVGVVFAAAFVPSVTTEPHDAMMDVVVTEAGTTRMGRTDRRGDRNPDSLAP